jgi:cold shock CspA family protein
MKGKVKMLNRERGFGFIRRENEPDLFFHASECGETTEESKKNFGALIESCIVEFEVGTGRRGEEGRSVVFISLSKKR